MNAFAIGYKDTDKISNLRMILEKSHGFVGLIGDEEGKERQKIKRIFCEKDIFYYLSTRKPKYSGCSAVR